MNRKAKILVVDDEAPLRLLLSNELARVGYLVDAVGDGIEAMSRIRDDFYQVVLLDIMMDGMDGISVLRAIKAENIMSEVIILTGNATVESAIECIKLGAFEYVRKPYSLNELQIQIERAIHHQTSQLDRRFLKEELSRRSGHPSPLIGTSAAMQQMRTMIERVAPTQSTVLILGGSGAGKELVARAIHEQSQRRERQMVTINCASFSENLLESELFGYEKGAFTDAKVQKRGLAEIADGGTLFLDEIGEIPLHFQAKLLRFLESGEIRRVGGMRDINLNVRILCATNRPLKELVDNGRFRDDLYYRLNVLTVVVPQLGEHRDDIPALVESFIKNLGFAKRLSDESFKVLARYAWPGNVRELKNVIERVCILSPESVITPDQFGFLFSHIPADSKTNPLTVVPVDREVDVDNAGESALLSMSDLERQHILRVLKSVHGHRGKAAKILQINPKTLYQKIRTYNIVIEYH